jgi:uncharacterized protein YidB (DUF937 family)
MLSDLAAKHGVDVDELPDDIINNAGAATGEVPLRKDTLAHFLQSPGVEKVAKLSTTRPDTIDLISPDEDLPAQPDQPGAMTRAAKHAATTDSRANITTAAKKAALRGK